jgi:hypothetical protein
VRDKVFACRLVKVIPQSLDVVTNVAVDVSIDIQLFWIGDLLDRHDANACQETHKNPKLPELRLVKQGKSSDV